MAQENELKKQISDTLVNSLDEVVVSATKTELKTIDVPSRIQTIPIYRMKANTIFNIDDIFSQISGLTNSRSDGVYSKKSTVSMRGMGGDQGRTLVLMDGVPYNKYSTGSVNWNMIDQYDVDRIEVVKGPGSSLYGGNAMGGTINIITKKQHRGVHGYAGVDYGSYNTGGANVGVNASNSVVYGGVSGFYRQGDGFNSYPEDMRDSTTIAAPLREYRASAFLGWNINKNNTIQFNGGYYDGLRGTGDRVFIKGEDPLDTKGRYQDQEYRLKYKGKGTNNSWEIIGYFMNEKMSETKYKSKQLYDVASIRQDWGAFANYSHKIGTHTRLLAGIEYKGGLVNGKDVYRTTTDIVTNRGKSDNLAALLQAEFTFFNNSFSIIPSLRYDISHFHDAAYTIDNPTDATLSMQQFVSDKLADTTKWRGALSPKLSMQYKFNESSRIYASVSSGWRPGSLEDMCWFGVKKTGYIVANPNLKAERVYTYEVGGDVFVLGGFTMSASAFYSDGHDFIYQVGTGRKFPDGRKMKDELKLSNVARARIFGAEADFVYTNLFTKGLDLFANYTYTNATITKYNKTLESDADLTGKFLTYTPEHLASAGVTYRCKYINANIAYTWEGKQYMTDVNSTEERDIIKAHGSLNAKIWYNFRNFATISLGGINLINEKYYTSSGQISMGRYLYIKLDFRF